VDFILVNAIVFYMHRAIKENLVVWIFVIRQTTKINSMPNIFILYGKCSITVKNAPNLNKMFFNQN